MVAIECRSNFGPHPAGLPIARAVPSRSYRRSLNLLDDVYLLLLVEVLPLRAHEPIVGRVARFSKDFAPRLLRWAMRRVGLGMARLHATPKKAHGLLAKAGAGGEERPRGPAPAGEDTARAQCQWSTPKGLASPATGLAGSAARTRRDGRQENSAAAPAASLLRQAIVTEGRNARYRGPAKLGERK
jgi:hypothetical protein